MKEGWEYKKLGEVCILLTDGDWIESKDQSCEGIRLIQTGNIGNGIYKDKTENSKFISEDTFVRLNCTEIFEGDVLVSRLPDPIGRSCIIPKSEIRMITAVDCSIVRLKEIILPKMFVYFSMSDNYRNKILKVATGTTRKRISRKNLSMIKIPLPPLTEQQRIVEELDLLSSIIEKKKEQLKELDALAQSIFYDMFGDPVTNEKGWEVEDIQSLFKVTSSKRILQSEWQDNGIPFYRVADIVNIINGINVSPSTFIKESTFSDLKRGGFVPSSGDILITSRGTLGQCYIVGKKDRFYFQDGMITWISPKNSNTNPIFVKSIFATNSFANSLTQSANSSTVAYISISQLSKKMLICPPLPLQQQFAQKVEAIERQKELIKQSIAETETLFNSRMDYYFN